MSDSSTDSDCNWQMDKPQIECSWQMFERQLATDVSFVIGDQSSSGGKKISAHKFMLIARSPVFERMFCGSLRGNHDNIPVPDCHSADAFTEMLRYMYTDKMQLDEDKVMDVLYLARKYMLPKATETCMRYVKHYCSPRNALRFLQTAIPKAEDEIQQVCMTVIQRQTSEVITSEYFEKAFNETVCLILCQKALNATEEQLFEACVKWAKHKLNIGRNEPCDGESLRDTLGQCLYKIQYQDMDVTSFTKLVVNQNILQQNDAFKYYQYFALKAEKQDDAASVVKIPDGFQTGRVRQQYCELEQVHWTYEPVTAPFCNQVNVDSIIIHSSKTVKLAMISMIIKIDPDIDMDPTRDVCHISDSLDTVVINSASCCQRIQYETVHSKSTNGAKENEQILCLHLHNVTPANQFQINLKLNSLFKMKLKAIGKRRLWDNETSVSFNVHWAENSMPVIDIAYILCN